MQSNGKTGSRKSTCLYLDQGVVETARKMGLNLSRVSENALVEAIGRLRKPERGTDLGSQANLEGRGPGVRLHRPAGYQATSHGPVNCEQCVSERGLRNN